MNKPISLKNVSIRYKLLASYVLVILLPFLLLLFINIHSSREENKTNAIYLARKILEETNSYLEYKTQAISEVLNFIAFNNLVHENVVADSAPYMDVNLWHMDALRLSMLVNQFRYNEDIDSVQLYMKQGLAGATEDSEFLNMGRVENEEWFRRFAESGTAFTWLPSVELEPQEGKRDSREISVLRKIPNPHNLQAFDGIVRARVKYDGIRNVMEHARLTPGTYTFLFNTRGVVLSSTDRFPFLSDQVGSMIQAYRSSESTNYWNEQYALDGSRYLIGIQDVRHTDMTAAILVPYSDILATSNRDRNRIVMIFLMIVPLMLPVSFIVTHRATKRILQLITHVRQIKNGRFPVAPLPISEDEIGELARNFNVMSQNITHLMDETYLLGREVKNKELQALQAQINPHFLYNTLDLINVMAIKSGNSDISHVVEELARFYKLSLSNGNEIVTLGNELQHVEAYVRIQNRRFGGGVELRIEVSRTLYECRVPKILLQPLVENAILHGIMEKDTEKGTLCLSAWMEEGDILIEVADNGVGMDLEHVRHIFEARPASTSKGSGYGVRNIQERLQLAYGPSYGLKYCSVPGEGTRVTVRVPYHPGD
ncbi:cache domain-containing sensor histidine kinase [Gorillibacterium sp. sgz5001074]|uniref:cache domain-containing sensor histidine kinase n=1 Tax=Gorillibacterium sp. sgz5001074 TaxID=3446695 RepID=UPI003F673C4B